jgi:hypothetical protein
MQLRFGRVRKVESLQGLRVVVVKLQGVFGSKRLGMVWVKNHMIG